MIELKGKYNKDCKIFIDDIENSALSLIHTILDQQVSLDVPIRIMPDVHAGEGIVIGFTMPLTNMLNPAYVGVDIGCGMISAKFDRQTSLDLEKIDSKIRNSIPMGFEINGSAVFKNIPFEDVQKIADLFSTNFNKKFNTSYVSPTYNEKWLNDKLKDVGMDISAFYRAIGTLGGGNHFIEIGKDLNTDYWVTIHSGSRNFGLKIANYWTNVAKGKIRLVPDVYNKELENIKMNTFDKSLISEKIRQLKERYKMGINKEFLREDDLMGYLYDMIFAQQYALWNRMTMLETIKKVLDIKKFDEIVNTIHNYIDFNDFIIRKGAISSYIGQKMIIPFNMRDGILLCEGKSNSDWNNSAPHGAGRLMSRGQAKFSIDIDKFKRSMKGIYSTSVDKNTLDESPFAYKNSKTIESAIEPTVSIINRIVPVLNIKDSGKSITWKERKLEKKKRELDIDAERRMKRRK